MLVGVLMAKEYSKMFKVKEYQINKFGMKRSCFFIYKRSCLGLYFATNKFFYSEKKAIKYCSRLNRKKINF